MEKELLIPSGSVLLNLACSDTWRGAFRPGRIVNIIGDSSAGKTLLALSMFAEMSVRPEFDGYRFIYDDAEHALDFDLESVVGEDCVSRIEPPATDDGEPVNSNTVQDFQYFVMKAIEEGKPFVYVLDSLDSLTTREEQDYVKDKLQALREGKQVSGTYGTEKAKWLSQILRSIVAEVEKTKSLVVIISQTRDEISPMSFVQKTRAGGRALKFYSSHEIWLTVGQKLKKTVSGRDYTIGTQVIAKVTKNKLTGKLREVTFPIYYSYGVDDVQACLDFLTKVGVAKKSGSKIKIEELGLEGMRKAVIKEVEEKGLWEDLFDLTEKAWNDIESKLADEFAGRVPKYRRFRRKEAKTLDESEGSQEEQDGRTT